MKALVLLNPIARVGHLTLSLTKFRYVQYGQPVQLPLSDLKPTEYVTEITRRSVYEYLSGLEHSPLLVPISMSIDLDPCHIQASTLASTYTVFVDDCGTAWNHPVSIANTRERLLRVGGYTGTFYTAHHLHSLMSGKDHVEVRQVRCLFYPMTHAEIEHIIQHESNPISHGISPRMLSWVETVEGSFMAALGCCPGTIRHGLRVLGENCQDYEI
jgi:predicted house-cleaning NTP pyrophosphatase (Maf/HAM1 superfamily)